MLLISVYVDVGNRWSNMSGTLLTTRFIHSSMLAFDNVKVLGPCYDLGDGHALVEGGRICVGHGPPFWVSMIEIRANAFKNNSGPVRPEPLDILLNLRSIVERYTTAGAYLQAVSRSEKHMLPGTERGLVFQHYQSSTEAKTQCFALFILEA